MSDATYTYFHSARKMITITEEELEDVKANFQPYLLKWLWMREYAYGQGWISEPAMKHSALRSRCNAYRDQARAAAFIHAMNWAQKRGYIQEINLHFEGQTGANPVLYTLTSAGKAWILRYDNDFRESHARPYLVPPTKEQFINERGDDKDWDANRGRNRSYPSRKKAARKKAAKKSASRKKAATKKGAKRK